MTLGAARVIWTINDLSTFVDQVTTGYVTYVIQSERGPMATPKVISSMVQYSRIFGKKVNWTTDPLVLEMCIRQGGQANVIRTAHYIDPADNTTCAAKKATMTLYDRGDSTNVAIVDSETGPFDIIQKSGGFFIGTEVGPFTVVTGSNDKLSLTVGSGSGCTIDIVASQGAITSVTKNAGGTGYSQGDTLNIASGTGGTANVDEVSTGGVVTYVSLVSAGSGYTTGTGKSTDCEQVVTIPGGTITAQAVANAINAYTTHITASSLLDESSGLYVLGLDVTDVTKTLSINAIAHSAYDLLGLPNTATDGHPVVSSIVAGTDTLIVSINGETAQTVVLDPIAGQRGNYVLSTGQIVQRLQALEDVIVYANENRVRIETIESGSNASIKFSSCTALSTLGFDTITHSGTSVGVSKPTLRIDAKDEGDWGDDISITVTESLLHNDIYFNLRVNYDRQGEMSEYYSDMSMDPLSDRYVIPYIKAASYLIHATDLNSVNDSPLNMPAINGSGSYLHGGDNGIEAAGGTVDGNLYGPYTFVTGQNDTLTLRLASEADQVITLEGSNQSINDVCLQINDSLTGATAVNYNNRLRIYANSLNDNLYVLSSQNNASSTLGLAEGEYIRNTGFTDADWIGEAQAQTGIFAADLSYMSMDLMVPGTTSVDVYQAMTAYCANRGDMMAYGQVPAGNDPEDAVNWRMGYGAYTFPAFDNCRFSLWFGRPLVYDDMDNSHKYIPCLGHLGSCLTKTDNMYGSWYAPVGPRRGTVTLCDGIDFNIQDYRSTSYADLFAEYGINYLMISKMPGIEGAMFWEQRTSQRISSATRDLNVMRFITVINRTLVPVLRTFLFELNHPVTWREIYRILQPAFDQWKKVYAIYDYALQCDQDAFFDGGLLKNAVLNSGLNIDQGIYYCRALIQPTRAIYYLEFTLGVMRTGESFEDYTSMTTLPGWIRQ